MAKARGRGVAAVNYPTGMNLGGDPSQALIHATTTGNFVVTLSSVDLGQGLKTVMTQICAETIGVPADMVIIDTADTDTGPHCMGTFASRGTHRIGNAIIMAAKEARAGAARGGGGRARGRAPPTSRPTARATSTSRARRRSRSRSSRRRSPRISSTARRSPAAACSCSRAPIPDPETGQDVAGRPAYAHACTVAEVEVDTETGEVAVLSLKSAYEIGRALNPQHGRAADRRRRLDGHEPRALRDDRALLSRPRPRAGRLQRISDARTGRPAGLRERRSSSARPPTGPTAPRASAR